MKKIDIKFLSSLLSVSRFVRSYDLGGAHFHFSRPSQISELWERIGFTIGEEEGYVAADVEVSPCYGLGARGLIEARFVRESIRGNSKVLYLKDAADGEAWAREMSEILPMRSLELAMEVGPALLERTAHARAAVNGYLAAFGTFDWKELWAKLELRATANEIREAERITRTPPTVQVYNGFKRYRAIVLGIILHSDQVEGRQIAPKGVEPWPNWDPRAKSMDWSPWGLAWRIELLADRMLGRYPEAIPRMLPGDDDEDK